MNCSPTMPIDNHDAPMQPTRSMNAPMQRVFRIGDVLNETYEITDILGEGGMGVVYEARECVLGRKVAIKISWPEIDSGALHREAQAMAALRGRGFPIVYTTGVHGGIPYYVMERIYGVTLERHLAQRASDEPVPIREVLDILIGVADALASVHRAGLVHRDVKPSNIMLASEDRVLLLDFGIVHVTVDRDCDMGDYGSPEYLAPEAFNPALGRGQPPHLRDIYALGVIAFELISGRQPFNSESTATTIFMHLNMQPPPLSPVRPDAPDALLRLIERMLAKAPSARPDSAEDVAAELRAILRSAADTTAELSARATAMASARH